MTDQQQNPAAPVDASFVTALRSNISGIYYQDVARFENEFIVGEFRKIVADAHLKADGTLMVNLLFLVRKRAIQDLYPDVAALIDKGRWAPRVMAGALKTLFALGTDQDRARIDHWLARYLTTLGFDADQLLQSPLFGPAEALGGPETLQVLTRLGDALTAHQQQLEQSRPDDHQAIALVDRVRTETADKVFVLTRKQAILAMTEPDRSAALARLYLLRPRHLEVWAYRLLTDEAQAGSIEGVRRFLDRELATLLPQAPDPDSAEYPTFQAVVQDYRLRGLCLLEAMGAELSAEERALLARHEEELNRREAFFRPRYDWEDLLDRQ